MKSKSKEESVSKGDPRAVKLELEEVSLFRLSLHDENFAADVDGGRNVAIINIKSECLQAGAGNAIIFSIPITYSQSSEEIPQLLAQKPFEETTTARRSNVKFKAESEASIENLTAMFQKLRISDIEEQARSKETKVTGKSIDYKTSQTALKTEDVLRECQQSCEDSQQLSGIDSVETVQELENGGYQNPYSDCSNLCFSSSSDAQIKERKVTDGCTIPYNRRKRRTKKRRGLNSSYNSSCSGDELMPVTVALVRRPRRRLSPASLSESCTDLCKLSDVIMKQLQFPRDNGRWEQFEVLVLELSNRFTSPEAKIVILLEESMAACYQNRLDESEEMIKRALEKSKDVENAASLIGLNHAHLEVESFDPLTPPGRAYNYLSGVYRRQKHKLGEATSCVEVAEQNFHNTAVSLDTSFLTYERASVLMDFIAQSRYPAAALVNEAKTCLMRCIDACRSLEQDDSFERYVKKHHFAFIKMAMLLLDCRTKAGRQRVVSEENIREAKHCLDTLEEHYWDGIAKGERVQFYLGRADYHYRLRSYQRAEEYAQEALDMAEEYGFRTEIQPAKDRLEEIRRQRAKQSQETLQKMPTPVYGDTLLRPIVTSDGQYQADVSSESESDCSLAGDGCDRRLCLILN